MSLEIYSLAADTQKGRDNDKNGQDVLHQRLLHPEERNVEQCRQSIKLSILSAETALLLREPSLKCSH